MTETEFSVYSGILISFPLIFLIYIVLCPIVCRKYMDDFDEEDLN